MQEALVAIVDCGGANIASLTNALDRQGVASVLTSDAHTVRNASHVILPGVGAAADAMQRLTDHHLLDMIATLSQPVLGICLGLQLFARCSEEGGTKCLGIVPSTAKRLQVRPSFPVPNTGWCQVRQTVQHELMAGIDEGSYFYFVHSFAVECGDYTLATAHHAEPFTAVLAQENFFATQFHPERSAAAGARVLSNFISIGS